jgi:beta-lactamase regulating signal transducer with metallopeptidase domain
MSFEIRLLIATLAAFAVANLLASGTVAALWPQLVRGDARVRARRLAWLRALPVCAAIAAALWSATAFMLFEARDRDETFGTVLTGLALLPVALIATAAARGVRAVLEAVAIRRRWLETAEPVQLRECHLPAWTIESAFPIVAVIGLLRPRLVIARSVLASCPPAEIRAILAHEQAHVTRRDNWMRLLLTVLPDALSWLPVSRRLAASWSAAAEDAADDGAGASGSEGRLALAQALVRVARLAPAAAPVRTTPLPATALFRGDDIARRVRRLAAPVAPAAVPRTHPARGVMLSAAMVAAGVLLMRPLHDTFEALVTLLP